MSLSFNIVYPINDVIFGDSFKEAIKNYIKLNRNMQITQMIIKDQSQQVRANLRYYSENGRDKVGINMFPVGLNYPIPVITDGYLPQLPVTEPLVTTLFPLSPIPLSPIMAPFVPTVINVPNV